MLSSPPLATGRKILFAIIACVMIGCALEAAARLLNGGNRSWVGVHRYHPVLGWSLCEGWSGEWDWADGWCRIDECGIRSDTPIRRKRPDEKRLLALGDSVTFGAKVQTRAAWPAQLEPCLHDAGMDWSVLNGGVPGYDPSQEVDWLEQFGWKLEPDVLAVGFCRNDVELSNRASSLGHQRLGSALRWVTEHSIAANKLERGLWSLQWRLGLLSATLPDGQEKAATLSGWPLVEQSYRRLDRLARARHVPVILVIFPKLPLIDGRPFDDYSERLQLLGRELGWSVIDVVDVFGPDGSGLFCPNDAIHLSESGHRRAAEYIAAALARTL